MTFLPGDMLVMVHGATWPGCATWPARAKGRRTVLIIDTHTVEVMLDNGCPVTTMQRCTVLTSTGVIVCNAAWLASNYDKVNDAMAAPEDG